MTGDEDDYAMPDKDPAHTVIAGFSIDTIELLLLRSIIERKETCRKAAEMLWTQLALYDFVRPPK